jgi:hypothetical protein
VTYQERLAGWRVGYFEDGTCCALLGGKPAVDGAGAPIRFHTETSAAAHVDEQILRARMILARS